MTMKKRKSKYAIFINHYALEHKSYKDIKYAIFTNPFFEFKLFH